MGKDENVMRVDLRVPLGIFERIELLSEKTNQPFTPKTKNSDNPKRVVTPIVLKLIELGLGVIDEDSSKLTQDLVSRDVDKSETIENRLFERLEKRLTKRLDELIESRLELFEARITADTSPPDIKEDNEDNEPITPEIVKEVSASELSTSMPKARCAPEPEKTIEAIIEDVTPEIKEDNSEDKEQGLSMGKLADRFKTNKNEGKGASKTSISTNLKKLSKEEFINWSKENDPENKAWYRNEADQLFYPQK